MNWTLDRKIETVLNLKEEEKEIKGVKSKYSEIRLKLTEASILSHEEKKLKQENLRADHTEQMKVMEEN